VVGAFAPAVLGAPAGAAGPVGGFPDYHGAGGLAGFGGGGLAGPVQAQGAGRPGEGVGGAPLGGQGGVLLGPVAAHDQDVGPGDDGGRLAVGVDVLDVDGDEGGVGAEQPAGGHQPFDGLGPGGFPGVVQVGGRGVPGRDGGGHGGYLLTGLDGGRAVS
jgi:hypothetical protein